jgi:hypothetical protein
MTSANKLVTVDNVNSTLKYAPSVLSVCNLVSSILIHHPGVLSGVREVLADDIRLAEKQERITRILCQAVVASETRIAGRGPLC